MGSLCLIIVKVRQEKRKEGEHDMPSGVEQIAEERFWYYIDKECSETFYNGKRCWEWAGHKREDGYGRLGVNHNLISVHKFSYELLVEPIPEGYSVLHYCGNRACVNPKHLFLQKGTKNHPGKKPAKGADNGRYGKTGELCPTHKLSNAQVVEIKEKFSVGKISQRKLGIEYGVSHTQISRIINNQSRQ